MSSSTGRLQLQTETYSKFPLRLGACDATLIINALGGPMLGVFPPGTLDTCPGPCLLRRILRLPAGRGTVRRTVGFTEILTCSVSMERWY